MYSSRLSLGSPPPCLTPCGEDMTGSSVLALSPTAACAPLVRAIGLIGRKKLFLMTSARSYWT